MVHRTESTLIPGDKYTIVNQLWEHIKIHENLIYIGPANPTRHAFVNPSAPERVYVDFHAKATTVADTKTEALLFVKEMHEDEIRTSQLLINNIVQNLTECVRPY